MRIDKHEAIVIGLYLLAVGGAIMFNGANDRVADVTMVAMAVLIAVALWRN